MIFSSSLELKVFLSARDYALSVQSYREVGVRARGDRSGADCFRHCERCAFLL